MNGHAKGCICQDCTIGREIGLDKALELIRDMRAAMQIQEEISRTGILAAPSGALSSATNARRLMLLAATAFLSEHAEHEGAKE